MISTYVTLADGTSKETDTFRCPFLVVDEPGSSFAHRCNAEVALDVVLFKSGRTAIDVACEHGHMIAEGVSQALRDLGRDEDGVPWNA